MILINFDRELPTTLCEAMLPLEYERPTRRDAENLDEMIGIYVQKGELSRAEARDLRSRFKLHLVLA